MVMNMPDEELAHEETHLSDTVEAIDNRMGQIRERMPAEAAHQETAELLQDGHVAELSHLKRMRPRPYHGRIDFEISEGTRVVRYLGDYQFGDVSSWTSPIAELFYRPASGKYFVEGQERAARVTLKRVFDIQEAALQSVSDVLRLAPPRELAGLPEGAAKDGYSEIEILDDPVLARALEETGQTGKHEIVATIQPEQYQYIAETEASVMVVQGAAGSGKSLIGFHRLAFLLSEFNRLTVRPRADRVIMLGPSLAFWAQAKNLLPSLGWSNIAQTTLREWMISNFTQRPRLESDDRLLRDLMSNQSKLTQQDLEAERFKGSWGMKTAIDDYVARRKRQIYRSLPTNLAKAAFRTAGGQRRTLDSNTLRRLIPNDDSPLNSARDAFMTALRRTLGFSSTPRGRVQLSLFASEADNELDELVSREWPRLRPEDEYVKLVEGTERLAALKMDPGARPGETDIAPLLYMDHLLNRRSSHGYEHIIIDEAQDISPLEVHLLNLHSRNGWFTILGDLRQRVAKYRGMESWTELRRVFPHDNVEPFVVQNSYRSTAQITRFANRILRKLPRLPRPPISHNRRGSQPKLERSASASEMLDAIALSARSALDRGRTVAVLTRTSQDASYAQKRLVERGVYGASELKVGGTIDSWCVVTPIFLTKGLEFDLVIIAGVDADSFTGSDLDNRLLYLACTRARHALEIHWTGRPSPLIRELGAVGMEVAGTLDSRGRKRSVFDRFKGTYSFGRG